MNEGVHPAQPPRIDSGVAEQGIPIRAPRPVATMIDMGGGREAQARTGRRMMSTATAFHERRAPIEARDPTGPQARKRGSRRSG